MADAASSAVDRLRSAIWAARPNHDWLSSDLIVFDLVQASIVRWVDDVERDLSRLAKALVMAEETTDVVALEDALIQAVSARDKLRAVALRVLGPGSLELYKQGVRFNPTERELRRVLSEVASAGVSAAGRAKALFEQLAGHSAVTLRNDVVHALTPFPQVADLCWAKRAYLNAEGGIEAWDRGPLYPEGSLDQENLLPETLYRWAVESAADVFGVLVQTTHALAEVIEHAGTITSMPACYRWPDGRIQLRDPRTGSGGGPLE